MERVNEVRSIPGLVAFWDFVRREPEGGANGNFVAHTPAGLGYPLEPHNVSRLFWKQGPHVQLEEFPLLGRGPFGQAVGFFPSPSMDHLPVLLVPRPVLHDTLLDIKGPGASVSMIFWLVYHGGNHALGGLWHEGTDTTRQEIAPVVVERGRRQFGLFAGLWAHQGAAAAHVSENGLGSFGDRYARHLAADGVPMKAAPEGMPASELDPYWTTAGFVFNRSKAEVTAYHDGVASEFWIENPAAHPYYTPTARAWRHGKIARHPNVGDGLDPSFDPRQSYSPPETDPVSEVVLSDTCDSLKVSRTYPYTRVRETWKKDAEGRLTELMDFQLEALKANPYWFDHDLYAPRNIADGGPFTIGRVIHSNRESSLKAWIGGVAVFNRALGPAEMEKLAALGRTPTIRRE